ncbi:hypothetical protein [Pectinatus haikarae]|uniref:hypothetical protein n=1 Tax=Pectinatus haikarae TaxID=349096 RepID=UPI0018C57C6D|nr:hypothetical protein [Pectinatus haikarae]
MSYNGDNPADTEYISAAPAEIRANQEQLRTGQIVDAKGAAGLIPSNNTGQIPVSNGTVCVNLNADMVDGHHASEFAMVGHVHAAATVNTDGFESAADKTKLDGIASGAEVNQNTFANVAVGSNTIQADSKQDTLTVVAGANINIVADTTNDKLTIAVTGCVLNSGGAISGALNLANNIQINGVDKAGTAYNLVLRDANNNSILGSTAYPTILNSSVNPTWSNGTATKTLATTDGTVANAANAVAATKATQDASGNVIIDTYAPLTSPTLTGTPKAPTAASGDNTTQIATTAFVTDAINKVVSGNTLTFGSVTIGVDS